MVEVGTYTADCSAPQNKGSAKTCSSAVLRGDRLEQTREVFAVHVAFERKQDARTEEQREKPAKDIPHWGFRTWLPRTETGQKLKKGPRRSKLLSCSSASNIERRSEVGFSCQYCSALIHHMCHKGRGK